MDFLRGFIDKLGKRPATDFAPTQVVEVRPEDYVHHTPHVREDSLIVYGIQPQSATVSFSPNSSFNSLTENTVNITTVNQNFPLVTAPVYEVIFTRETPGKVSQQLFSLSRYQDLESATQSLKMYADIIPTLSCVCPSLMNVDTLQDVCDYLRQYPKHSLAHVAANFSFHECFKHATVQQEAAILICPETHLTPLHVAVKSGKLNVIQTILCFNPKLDVRDKTGSNVLHFAASTSKEIISLICTAILCSASGASTVPALFQADNVTGGSAGNSGSGSSNNSPAVSNRAQKASTLVRDDTLLLQMINERNRENVSPIHLACISDKPECVKELLKHGADVNGACMQSTVAGTNRIRPQSSTSPNSSSSDASPENNNTGFDKVMIENLNSKDMKNGGNPLHWAKSPQCMEPLIEMGCNINAKNFSGETVLHVMVARRQLACVVTLLSYGAEVNEKGPNGVTPLHLAVKSGDVSVVQALVVFQAKLNVETSAGETARHLAALSKRTASQDMILYVLNSVGAKRCTRSLPSTPCTDGCSCTGVFNGVPPENAPFTRIASLYDPLLGRSIVKAAVTKKKKSMFSPSSSLAKNSSPTISRSSTNESMHSHDTGYQNDLKESAATKSSAGVMDIDADPNTERKDIRVLALDGGGIKGLVLIQMLAFLEEFTGSPIYETFDWIAGTSTGGILALVIASGYSAAQCRQFYFKMKNKVFVGTRPYESEQLDSFLKKTFGETSTMADISKPRVMLTATVADKFPAELHLFRNYKSPNDILGHACNSNKITSGLPNCPKPEEVLMWAAARSSGAAPTYFRPCGRYLDGGLISNNPTLDLLTEITYYNAALDATRQSEEKVNIVAVLSLGTGAPPPTDITIIDVYRPDSLVGIVKMGLIASSLGQLLVDQASQSDGQVVERARAWCSMTNIPYFRSNPPMSENISMDETNNAKLIHMLWETHAYMHTRKEEFDELRLLLQ